LVVSFFGAFFQVFFLSETEAGEPCKKEKKRDQDIRRHQMPSQSCQLFSFSSGLFSLLSLPQAISLKNTIAPR